jgi:hypothetical protein
VVRHYRADEEYVMRVGIRPVHGVVAAALVALAVGTAGGGERAIAQGGEQVASGPVVELAASRATIAANTGPVTVQFDAATRYEREGRGSIQEIQPGQFVGATGRPTADGLDAVEVHVFSPLQTSVRQGQNSMSGANAGNLMTNAIVESFVDGVLTLRFADQSVSLNTSPATEFRRPEPASAADLYEEGRIVAMGTLDADGVLHASDVYVQGPPRQ